MPAEDPSTDAAMPACDFVLWPPLGPDDPVDAAFAVAGGAGFIEFRFRSEKYDH